jgi:phage protein D
MAEILNLNQARKAKTREKARQTADENAVKFGRTKTQKQRETAQAKKAQSQLDGHKRGE